MSKIRVLSDHIANQIAAGEVVERPASVAKELVENSIDAGARRIEVEVEAGGRKLLRVADDGSGMTRDDAVLAFERHATSKISTAEDLNHIRTLGFRGEALASIASVARIELLTGTEGGDAATRVRIEGGRILDVAPAARPRGTTITVRDLFFNVPARRKFLRSEATESFHLTNLITHYALAHPEIAILLTNNGRETLRAAAASDLRERAYQIFGAEFLDNLLEVTGGQERIALVRGYVSAPRERRTTRDAQYLFVNGRFVRDRLISRALSDGYRSVLPQGVYPAAILFLDVPFEEVDVNVHPAKTEVRFRRAAAVADAVRDSVRAALASGGYLRRAASDEERAARLAVEDNEFFDGARRALESNTYASALNSFSQKVDAIRRGAELPAAAHDEASATDAPPASQQTGDGRETEAGGASAQSPNVQNATPQQSPIEFGPAATVPDAFGRDELLVPPTVSASDSALEAYARGTRFDDREAPAALEEGEAGQTDEQAQPSALTNVAPQMRGRLNETETPPGRAAAEGRAAVEGRAASEGLAASEGRAEGLRGALPPLVSAAGLVREVPVEMLSQGIRPLGQMADSFIVATDEEGLLLIDQHVAHERILFDKYRALEATRRAESQSLLMPETFDLTPAQAIVFDAIVADLEAYGFELMRLSGRTVAVRSVPADLPATSARQMLAEVLNLIGAEKHRAAHELMREKIAAALACRAAVKANTPLTSEKMRWLVERLLHTSAPTTDPHGRPVVLRLSLRDIEKGFHRS